VAYSEGLAERVRGVIGDHPALTERKMFGGIAFMLQGNMATGVAGDDLIVRVPAADWDACLALPHTRIMDITGRPMRGWLFVSQSGVADDASLSEWVERGMAHALSLPAKGPVGAATRGRRSPRSR